MTRVFTKNRSVPQTEFAQVVTTKDNQESMTIQIFQGMNDNDSHMIRDFSLIDLPKGDAGLEIDLRYTLDRDGILSVQALDEDGKVIAV